ncbi:OB-fold domain-containing protein [Microbacterium sp. NC79]|uniref:Zn-ribbon domain-containing OB-fold protein n=1 Tax=Microbacterium sp. NC79 TaxID=2851009 RepID=UPI001C2B92B7|nr:OB-fold domain-containing protein [Microbacterium sp. NC79]
MPRATPETQPFWDGANANMLTIQHCTACDEWVFYPRERCSHCAAAALEWRQASGRGRIWSFIVVHRAEPAFADLAPYVLAVVELDEGPRMTGIVHGVAAPDTSLIDAPVIVRFDARGDQQVPVWQLESAS